jgi:FYVE, RhoGEF and PH domain containing 5/6
MALNAMHPNSTLTSSSSNAHIRRALQAIPYSPEDEASGKKPRRGRVEHFVPAIWVPDAKTECCMRCGRTFGWRRRRHHCRLCGRCVCAACSEQVRVLGLHLALLLTHSTQQTFYVADPSNSGAKNKPARACNACYETVFPLVEDEPTPSSSEMVPSATMSTLSNFPTWQSVSTPALALSNIASKQASALLASDFDTPSKRMPSNAYEGDAEDVFAAPEAEWNGGTPPSPSRLPRIRVRQPSQRPKSYVQILEEFTEEAQAQSQDCPTPHTGGSGRAIAPSMSRTTSALSAQTAATSVLSLETDPTEASEEASSSGSPRPTRREDTIRRHKRFSMPAMALQTTSVMVKPTTTGEGKSKRFSLVLGRSGGTRKAVKGKGPSDGEEGRRSKGLAQGAAASKLSELLGRNKQQ